jgi:hypothetical protein
MVVHQLNRAAIQASKASTKRTQEQDNHKGSQVTRRKVVQAVHPRKLDLHRSLVTSSRCKQPYKSVNFKTSILQTLPFSIRLPTRQLRQCQAYVSAGAFRQRLAMIS